VSVQRPTRAGQRGFTLVEVLVSVALLSIVATVLAVVFSLGMRTILAPGASQDRLDAASNAIAFEQPLIQDVQRASCIHFPDISQYSEGCDGESAPFQHQQGQCSGDVNVLCLEWPDLVNSGRCDMALYILSTNPISRIAWQGSSETATSFPGVAIKVLSTSGSPPVGLEVLVTSDGPLPASPPASPLANPPSVTLHLQALASPWPTLSAAPSAGVSTSPC
jgi:prepilin-type N-terminal cleavage/methylation domain-containing protein